MKFLPRFHLILMFLSMPILGRAQTYYSDTSTFDRAAAFYTTLEVFDNGNITAFGGASDTAQVTRPNFLALTKRNISDTTVIFREAEINRYFSTNSKKINGKSFVVGSSSYQDSLGIIQRNTFIFKFDSLGEMLQYTKFPARPGITDCYLKDLTLLDNRFYLLGYERKVVGNTQRFDLVVYVLDSANFTVHGIYEFGQSNLDEFPLRITPSNNGTLLNGANKTDFSSSSNTNYQTWIFETDTQGNILNQYLSPLTIRESGPGAMIQTSDGGIQFVSTRQVFQQSTNSTVIQAFMAKINSQFQPAWDSSFGQTSHWVLLRDMVRKADGRLYSCGEMGIVNGITPFYYGWLNAHSPTGGHLWQRFYLPFGDGEQEEGQLDAIRAHPDGGFVMAGQARAYGPSIVKGQHAWLLKVDSLGCLVPGCAVGIKELTPEAVYLKVWPNPAQGEAFVLYKSAKELPETYLVLSDMLGRERRRAPVPETDAQYHLRLHDLEAGLYVVQLWHQGRLLAREKLIIQ
jgi:hypothetical protein